MRKGRSFPISAELIKRLQAHLFEKTKYKELDIILYIGIVDCETVKHQHQLVA